MSTASRSRVVSNASEEPAEARGKLPLPAEAREKLPLAPSASLPPPSAPAPPPLPPLPSSRKDSARIQPGQLFSEAKMILSGIRKKVEILKLRAREAQRRPIEEQGVDDGWDGYKEPSQHNPHFSTTATQSVRETRSRGPPSLPMIQSPPLLKQPNATDAAENMLKRKLSEMEERETDCLVAVRASIKAIEEACLQRKDLEARVEDLTIKLGKVLAEHRVVSDGGLILPLLSLSHSLLAWSSGGGSIGFREE